MHVAAAWVVVAFILGGGVGIVIAALLAASKVADAQTEADAWRRGLEDAQAALARERGEPRAAGRREELAAVLADAEGARPVGPCPAMAVHEGADVYPFGKERGILDPAAVGMSALRGAQLIMQDFVDKCDRGEARSVHTLEACRGWLAAHRVLFPDLYPAPWSDAASDRLVEDLVAPAAAPAADAVAPEVGEIDEYAERLAELAAAEKEDA